MTLGQNIARLRTQKNLSQGDLADALEVSRQSVSKWETDASIPELDKLLRLAELFGVTTDYLLTGTAADGRDDAALRALWAQMRERLDGTLLLRDKSGAERPFGEAELALLLAAALGEAD